MDWNRNKVNVELETICKRNHIDFINPQESIKAKIKERERERKQLHFPKDGHWNRIGHKFFGEIFAEYVTTKYLENNSRYDQRTASI